MSQTEKKTLGNKNPCAPFSKAQLGYVNYPESHVALWGQRKDNNLDFPTTRPGQFVFLPQHSIDNFINMYLLV